MINPLPPQNTELDAKLMTIVTDFRNACGKAGATGLEALARAYALASRPAEYQDVVWRRVDELERPAVRAPRSRRTR